MGQQPHRAGREEQGRERGQAGAALGQEHGDQRHAPHPVVGPADRGDEQRGDGRDDDAPAVVTGPAREPQPGGGEQQRREHPGRARCRVAERAGEQALQGLVVDDPGLAHAVGLVEAVEPEVRAGGRQDEDAEQDGGGEGGGRGERLAGAAGEEEIRDEDGRGELDPGRDAHGHALAGGAGRAGEVPQDQAGEQQVDLAEEEGLEDRFEPECQGCARAQGRKAQGPPRQPGGEVDEAGDEQGVGCEERRLEGRDRNPGRRDEQERREGRVGGGQLPLGDPEAVQIAAAQDRLALGPVDQRVRHRQALYGAQGGEGPQGNGQEEEGSCGV